MRALVLAAAALVVGLPQLASAQTYVGATKIINGDLSGAERLLAAEHRLSPENPQVMLNLAVVYAQTERSADARAMYQQVLSQPDEDMTLASGAFVSSHRLAADALQRLGTAALAVR